MWCAKGSSRTEGGKEREGGERGRKGKRVCVKGEREREREN